MFKFTFTRLASSTRGFSLVDMMLTLAVVGTVAAIAVPAMTNAVDGQRLGIDAQNVMREMQLARLTAVSTNRPMRIRFNCPSTGYYRRVELVGNVNAPNSGIDADNQAAVRCGVTYPYPAADNDPLTRPNNDGPVQQLNSKVSFTSTQTLEFWPNGTVHVYNAAVGAPWPQLGTTPANIILTKGATTRSITVNSLGKMQIQ
jgi:Tfp pilus assembly protein FimT